MGYQATGAMGGAVAGAQAGTMIAPGIGTVVGAVVGAAAGYLSGSQAAAAQRAANRAKRREREMSMRSAWVQRREMIRAGRISMAQQRAAIAAEGEGGFASSAPRGAMGSLTSQFVFDQRYFARRIYDFLKMQKDIDKAGKYAQRAANTQSYMDMAASAASMVGGLGGGTKTVGSGSGYAPPSGASSPGYIPGGTGSWGYGNTQSGLGTMYQFEPGP